MNGLHYIQRITEGKARKIFIISSIFYISLFFCSSNILFLLLSLLYCSVLWFITRSIQEALLLTFIAVLPFNKGKTLQIPLLPTSLSHVTQMNDMYYHATFTISDIFLVMNYYVAIRTILLREKRPPVRIAVSTACFILFILYAGITSALNGNYVVPLLSTAQLVKLLFILLLPTFTKAIHITKFITIVLIAFTIFQSAWGGIQYIQKSKLGKYIEATSNEYLQGKVAWENPDLFRINGTFVDPDLYGTFMLMMVAFCSTNYILEAKNKKQHIFSMNMYAILAGISILSIILTGNRAIYLLIPLILFVIVMRTKAPIEILRKLISGKNILITVFILLAILPYLILRLRGLSTLFNASGSGTFRIQMIYYSARLGIDALVGVGLNLSPYYFATAFPTENFLFGTAYPHNLFMQIFSELGIIGLILFLAFIYLVYRQFLLSKYSNLNLPFYLASMGYLACALFYPLFLNNIEIISFFILFIGIAIVQI
jgi:hypothetical protein